MPRKIYLTGLTGSSNKRRAGRGGGFSFSGFSFENQDKMLTEKLLEGNWCVSPLSSVPYKGKFSGVILLFKIVNLFYGGNEHQIGFPG